MDNLGSLRKTPNYDMHVKYGGKVVDFGGWALSVQFSGILEEHKIVREKVGLFDVSHMGEATVVGEQALPFLQKLVSRDLSTMVDGQIYYTHMLYPNGGTVDDLMVTRYGPTDYYLVINASNAAKDVEWMQKLAHEFPKVKVTDISADTAELALQGPLAPATLQKLTRYDLSKLKYYHAVRDVEVAGIPKCIISRTGYTGEDGFEVFTDPRNANKLWEAIMDAGQEFGIKPIGLGARDTLRFEASMPLYGQELDENTSPLEAGLGRFVNVDKPTPFIGQEALKKQVAQGLPKKLVGFEMVDRGIPRHNYKVAKNGKEIGYVTTGSYSPTLDRNIGNAFVPVSEAKIGNEFDVIVRDRPLKARIIKVPFYRRKK